MKIVTMLKQRLTAVMTLVYNVSAILVGFTLQCLLVILDILSTPTNYTSSLKSDDIGDLREMDKYSEANHGTSDGNLI